MKYKINIVKLVEACFLSSMILGIVLTAGASITYGIWDILIFTTNIAPLNTLCIVITILPFVIFLMCEIIWNRRIILRNAHDTSCKVIQCYKIYLSAYTGTLVFFFALLNLLKLGNPLKGIFLWVIAAALYLPYALFTMKSE